MKPWKAIAAISLNGVIGKDNAIPWHIPEDSKWVKETTTGQIVVMGRKTFDSIGRPLPNRENIIVSRSMEERDGLRVVRGLAEVEAIRTEKEIWILGGEQIYRKALPRCDELFLTIVKRNVRGDTYFPEFEGLFTLRETLREEADFCILHYVRKPFSPASS